ncbi:MAG: hypothetical protein WKF84_16190 [Pyrinomonadaceae bacterium]
MCNQKNEKAAGSRNGHLKQLHLSGGQASQEHFRGQDVLGKCQTCGALYTGPPPGHLRDPQEAIRVRAAGVDLNSSAAGACRSSAPVIRSRVVSIHRPLRMSTGPQRRHRRQLVKAQPLGSFLGCRDRFARRRRRERR